MANSQQLIAEKGGLIGVQTVAPDYFVLPRRWIADNSF